MTGCSNMDNDRTGPDQDRAVLIWEPMSRGSVLSTVANAGGLNVLRQVLGLRQPLLGTVKVSFLKGEDFQITNATVQLQLHAEM